MKNLELLNTGEDQGQLESGMEGDEILFSDVGVYEGREMGLIEMGMEAGILPDKVSIEIDREEKFGEDEEDHRPYDHEELVSFGGDIPGYVEKMRKT